MKKKKQDGVLYFTQKNIVRPLGGGIVIAALAMAFFPLSWIAFVIAGVLAPVGLVMFFVGGSKFISDKEMEEIMGGALLDYDRPVTDMSNYEHVILRIPSPFESSAYSFGEDAAYFKWSQSSVISDRYVRTHFFFTLDTFIVISRRLSLTELDGKGGVADLSETYHRSGITARLDEHTATVTVTVSGKPAAVKWYEFVLLSLDGEELLRLPVSNDIDVTGLCETINRK